MAQKAQGSDSGERRLVCSHRKARFHYEVLDTFEAGLALKGTEVKALRQGKMSIEESFGRVQGDELWLVGAHVQEYSHGNVHNHEPTRKRKLLMHRREIRRLKAKVTQKGLTLVPLEVYFSARGLAKVRLGLCKGRKVHDKREKLKTRDDRRAMREG
jgi:SsrA-binding protein